MPVLWDYRVVLDLFLGGVGAGAFLLATILFFMNSSKYESIIKRSFILAPIMIIIGLLLLLTELGRPLSVYKAVFNTNFESIMSIGMFLQGICVALMLLVVLKVFTSKVENVSKPLVIITSLFAALVGIYHGFLLTGIERAAWSDSIPTLFFISSLLAGTSLVVLVNSKDENLEDFVSKINLPLVLVVLLILQVIATLSWVYSLALSGTETYKVYESLFSMYALEFYVFMILGTIVPLFMLLFMVSKKCFSKNSLVLASSFLVLGSLVLKYVVVYLGQMV